MIEVIKPMTKVLIRDLKLVRGVTPEPKGIPAMVLAVLIGPKGNIQYNTVWYENGSRQNEYLHASEIKTYERNQPLQTIGFLPENNKLNHES